MKHAVSSSHIPYTVIRSSRKTIALQITPEGNVLVRCPRKLSQRDIEAFVTSKRTWLEKHLYRISAQPRLPAFTDRELLDLAAIARTVLPDRVAFYADRMGVTYGTITIRRQRTRWGSCTAQGNLNFNCLLMLLPPEVQDYVVVHELCHRRELNHSPRFWAEVEKVLPDYQTARAYLKDHGAALIHRLP